MPTTTIAIDDEADEVLSAHIVRLKKRARAAKQPTTSITKRNIASAIIKRALRVPSAPIRVGEPRIPKADSTHD